MAATVANVLNGCVMVQVWPAPDFECFADACPVLPENEEQNQNRGSCEERDVRLRVVNVVAHGFTPAATSKNAIADVLVWKRCSEYVSSLLSW